MLRVRTVDARWRAGRRLPPRAVAAGPRRRSEAQAADEDIAAFGDDVDASALVPTGWDLAPLRAEPLGPLFVDVRVGDVFAVEAGETVTSAPELARLSLNMAHAHTDAGASAHGRRLVYGGHVIGIAAAHVCASVPDLATILAWESCDHIGPTFEGDRLQSCVEVTRCARWPTAASCTWASPRQPPATAADPRDVLDWRLVGADAVTGILEGLTVVEGSAFVAAPLGGMTLAQLGADVIRFDDLRGGLDTHSLATGGGRPVAVLGRDEQGQAVAARGPRFGGGRGARRER